MSRNLPLNIAGLRTGAVVFFYVAGMLALMTAFTGCGETPAAEETAATSTSSTTPTATTPPYQRQAIDFFRGIYDPRPTDWEEMLPDSGRLMADGINAITISPPVNITARAGGSPRSILEGTAASAESRVSDFHEKGFAVHVAPTTAAPGFAERTEPTDTALEHLREDAVIWARKAEEGQAELFSPLARFNMVLGTADAARWSAGVLPQIRLNYQGLIGAWVIPDLETAPAAGQPHDFEKLDYKGYDYLLLEIYPPGSSFDPALFETYLTGLLDRAGLVARRDSLMGVIVSGFGGWRETAGEEADGPILGEQVQAQMADIFLRTAIPRTKGIFFRGWTEPGRGARGFLVEEMLKKYFVPLEGPDGV